MKFVGFLLTSLFFVASVHAQYFSAGWTPGQRMVEEPPAQPEYTFDPAAQVVSDAPAAGGQPRLGLVDKLLASEPVSALFGKIGLNMSEVLARGGASPWDERIPLITDENYEEIIVNETLSAEEEKDRVWFLIVSVTSSQNSEISKIVDKSFDDAYNETITAGDLPQVRWGRIDYLSVTYLTTKWVIWTGPYLVVLKDRGQSLRFYKADRVRISKELIRELLKEELWRETPVWNSNFAPGGKREFVLHYYGIVLKAVFGTLERVPRFLLMIVSGGVASIIMKLLHKPETEQAQEQPQPSSAVSPKKPTGSTVSSGTTAVASSATTASSTATSTPKKGKQRKNAKK